MDHPRSGRKRKKWKEDRAKCSWHKPSECRCVRMWCVKMLQAVVSVVPFVLSPHSRAFQLFLQHGCDAELGQPQSFFAHTRGFYRSICIFLFYVLPLCNWFCAHRLARTVCSQIRCKVLSDGLDVAVNTVFMQKGLSPVEMRINRSILVS